MYDLFALNLTQIGVHIWTVVTFWLLEPNLIVLLGNVLCIHLVRARTRVVHTNFTGTDGTRTGMATLGVGTCRTTCQRCNSDCVYRVPVHASIRTT